MVICYGNNTKLTQTVISFFPDPSMVFSLKNPLLSLCKKIQAQVYVTQEAFPDKGRNKSTIPTEKEGAGAHRFCRSGNKTSIKLCSLVFYQSTRITIVRLWAVSGSVWPGQTHPASNANALRREKVGSVLHPSGTITPQPARTAQLGPRSSLSPSHDSVHSYPRHFGSHFTDGETDNQRGGSDMPR